MAQIVNVLNLRCQYLDVISLPTIPAQAFASPAEPRTMLSCTDARKWHLGAAVAL